jgi:hypothetical protein
METSLDGFNWDKWDNALLELYQIGEEESKMGLPRNKK